MLPLVNALHRLPNPVRTFLQRVRRVWWRASGALAVDSPAGLIRRIRAERVAGRLSAAEALVDRALQKYPDVQSLLLEASEVALLREQWDKAAQYLRRSVELQPGSASALTYARLIRAERNAGRLAGAEGIAGEALERFPGSWRVLAEAAMVAMLQECWDRAISRWECVERTSPGDMSPMAYVRWADACRMQGDYAKARHVLELGLARYPEDPVFLAKAAKIAADLGFPYLGEAIACRVDKVAPAALIEERLWGGFSRYALRDLETLKSAPSRTGRKIAADCAWILAGWYAAEGDLERALENIAIAHKYVGSGNDTPEQTLLEAYCLSLTGAGASARAALERQIAKWPKNPHLLLAMSNTFIPPAGGEGVDSDAVRLSWINRAFENEGLNPVAKADPARPLCFDNLVTSAIPGVTGPYGTASDVKVSVIMPAYNAVETLPFALDSLLQQSWHNLEIIVVDDCSDDDTFALVEEYALRDPRIIPVRQPRNRGSYAARNRGLEVATGEFITVHDANDWSHAQKIELQARHLLENEEALANYTFWARALHNLHFLGKFRSKDKVVHMNPSSLLFRRSLLERVGGWDEVRVSADAEFIHRVRQCFPGRAISAVRPSVPLSFAFDLDASLTKNRVTHGRTLYHGVRREYHEAASFWRETAPAGSLTLGPGTERRPFPVPGLILPERENDAVCDVLVVADFNWSGESQESALGYVKAGIRLGLSVAILHWRHYRLDPRLPLNREIRKLAQCGGVRAIAPGERVRVQTVVIVTPAILQYLIDLPPGIETQNVVVIADRIPAEGRESIDYYEPATVLANVRKTFSADPVWTPAADFLRGQFSGIPGFPQLDAVTWVPLLETGDTGPPWRGRERERPVIGRKAPDDVNEWPDDTLRLRAAYCADRPCDVALVGGSWEVRRRLGGKLPSNWRDWNGNTGDQGAFFRDIDFFVSHPREEAVATRLRMPVFEAMARGCPVVLPPSLRPWFGDAAVYAEPEDVWPAIERLWQDESAWLAQARAGQDFAMTQCSPDNLRTRLALETP